MLHAAPLLGLQLQLQEVSQQVNTQKKRAIILAQLMLRLEGGWVV